MNTPPRIRIDQSLGCPACGYDLRGLMLEATCPECGANAADALDHLSLSGHKFLRRLRSGALLAAFAAVNIPLAYVAMTAVYLVPGSMTGAGLWTIWLGYVVLAVGLAVGPVLGAFGWSRLRSAQPPVLLPDGRVHRPSYRPASALVLPLSWLFAGLATALIVAYSMNAAGFGTWRSSSRDLLAVGAGLTGCFWGLRMFLGLRRVSELLNRLGRGRAAASAVFWAGVSGGAVGVCVLGGVLTLVLPSIPLSLWNLETYDVGLICLVIALAGAVAITLGNLILQIIMIGALTGALATSRARNGAPLALAGGVDAPTAKPERESP